MVSRKENVCCISRYIEAAAKSDAAEHPQAAAAGLCFDAREALVLAQRCGLKSVARKLLLLRGDYSAAIALSEDVDTAFGCVSQAPPSAHRNLWIQFAQRRAADKAEVVELQSVVQASGGCLSPEDLLPLIPRGERKTIQQMAELVEKHLDGESAKLRLLDKQFKGLGDCMTGQRNALQDLQQRTKDMGKSVTGATVCAACGNVLSRKPKHGRSLGVLPLRCIGFVFQRD